VDQLSGPRPLDSKHRDLIGNIRNVQVKTMGIRLYPIMVFLSVPSIVHDQMLLILQTEDEHIIFDSTLMIADQRILSLSVLEGGYVVGRYVIQ
jgi:hypothetical protein